MSKLILNTECGLYGKDNKAYCTSRQVGSEFEKRHDNVLRDIDKLDCSEEFRLLNFEESSYKNEQGKKQLEVIMTKDGFTFLIMGYKGKKAAKFKEAYILRFNQMDEFLRTLAATRLEHPAFTQAIMDAHETPKHYHFSNETDMINRIVLGMSAKQYREERGLEKGCSIRPYLTIDEIKAIESLQRIDIGLMIAIPEYEDRKNALMSYFDRTKLKRIA